MPDRQDKNKKQNDPKKPSACACFMLSMQQPSCQAIMSGHYGHDYLILPKYQSKEKTIILLNSRELMVEENLDKIVACHI